MKNVKLIPTFLFKTWVVLLLCQTVACSGQEMVKDPSGMTQLMVPKGWKVETKQEGNSYLWLASQSTDENSPGLMQLILPDAAYTPKELVLSVFSEQVQGLKILQELNSHSDEGHYLLEGTINNTFAKLAIHVVRDPGKYLFLTTFSAPSTEFDKWGGPEFLYKVLQSYNPYNSPSAEVASPSNQDYTPTGTPLTGSLNMQDVQIKRQMLQVSAPFTAGDLTGKWMQVFEYATGNDAKQIESGEISLGSRGQGHMLSLMLSGKYELSYLYNLVSGVCRNRSEITETGKWSVTGNQLILTPDRYRGKIMVCGKETPENKSKLPTRHFKIGTDATHDHLTIFGKPFEYSVNTDWDENGVEYILEGFTRIE
jgi:hypothetical protein